MEKSRVSKIQRQFLVNTSLFQDSNAYTIASLVEITGPLDQNRLRNAWNRIWEAAAILRARYDSVSDSMVLPENEKAPWKEYECTEETLISRATTEANLPIDLGTGLLARFVLYKITPEKNYALLVQHHIITDLFSKNLLAESLSRAYNDPEYTPRFESYSRFSETEEAFLESAAGAKAKEYWGSKLRPFTEALKLPHSGYIQHPFQARGRCLPWSLASCFSSRLDAEARKGRIPFLLLLTAYASLLARLSGTSKFLIGVPLSNRRGIKDAPILGPCVNILPVAVDIDPECSLGAVYEQVRREMLLNHRYQEYPFLQLAESYRGRRDSFRPYLLQAGFTNEPLMNLQLKELKCSGHRLDRNGSQMDVFFTWWKQGTEYEGVWEYNEDTFSAEDIVLWQHYYERLLESVLQSPSDPVFSVRLMDRNQEAVLTGEGKSVPYPLDKSLAFHLRKFIAEHEDLTALRYKGSSIRYSEFSRRVASVASSLYGACGKGGRIVVLLDRSPDLVVALHGIIQSGNAYVPIGIDWPQDRIGTILEDVDPSAVLTSPEYTSRFAGRSCPIFRIEDLTVQNGPVVALPDIDISPDDSMYILYTSGTTGKPKGANLLHRGLVNRLLWMQDEYKLLPGRRVLLASPYTFDVSIWQFFWPFLAGATLVVAEEHLQHDPRDLLRLIDGESVDTIHSVPSMLRHLLSYVEGEKGKTLKDVICSGEALPLDLETEFFRKLPGARLHNLYGPTEASIDVTNWECTPDDQRRGTVPIGKPIANTQVYVLDKRGGVCPPLIEGEIYLAGVGLARSYWRNEDLTNRAFLPNPFGEGRLYKTGDAGRYASDGAIEYLGRLDDQIKIRGIRIESGEVESNAKKVPGVQNAVLKKGNTSGGEECLIIYYTGDREISVGVFRDELSRHMPASMIPEYYVYLQTLPMSENGKLDRKSLPSVVLGLQKGSEPSREATGDSVEQAVELLWRKTLGKASIRHDINFFDAGGHSLSLLNLRELLEKEFHKEVPVTELFRRTTIAGMADLFRSDGGGNSGPNTAVRRAEMQRQRLQDFASRTRDKAHRIHKD